MILSTGERSSSFDSDGSRLAVGLWSWNRVGLNSELSALTDGVTCTGVVEVELGNRWMSSGRVSGEVDGLFRPCLKFEG